MDADTSPTVAPDSTDSSAEVDSMALARSAADNALAFAEHLAQRFSTMAESFRAGDDSNALTRLGESADDLEHFLTFLVLIAEMVEDTSPQTFHALRSYRDQLMSTLEGLQPALGDLDLVEVADTIEHDLVLSLVEYRQLSSPVQEALEAA